MTATLARQDPDVIVGDDAATAESAAVGRQGPRVPSAILGSPMLVASAAVGSLVIGLSYRFSSQGRPAELYYLVFWAGLLTALLPVVARLTASNTRPTTRFLALALFGVVTLMPKILRNPTGPLYHDEYAHWREAVDVTSSGRLFQPNATIPIVEFFPGTSALTTTTESFGGLSPWSAGLLVVIALHVLGLFGVYVLGDALLSSPRAGAVAAAVYGINPSAIYFDTQYAYESLAVNFFLWALALTTLAKRADSARTRRAYSTAAVLAGAACVVTHHLTTIFLIVALLVVTATGVVRARLGRRRQPPDVAAPDTMRPWWVTLVCTTVIAVAWVMTCARPTLDYLSPYLGSAVGQLKSMSQNSGQGGRQLLAANVEPEWERLLTAAAPVVVLCCFIAAAALIRRTPITLDSPTWGMIVFGCGYFVSLPFILAPSGAEGARRSWGFTYVGVALVVALVAVHWPSDRPHWAGRSLAAPLQMTLLVTLVIGNVGGGLNDPYRFPGPFRWGTDTNSASAETRSVAEELGKIVGRSRVVTDAYTALELAAYGGLVVAAPSVGFPAWDLTQRDADPSPELARMLTYSDYDYLVVDIRMAQEAPFNGHNFGQNDPLLGHATPMANLTRLDHVPWAWRVMSTEHLRVYRLDLGAIARERG
ncbi:hypothetical protein MMAD_28290 [Mycolicibacterium madagascariense]|uniref:Glycosyltransferase RgtA/B/C/D-like domain-containing protein n=1 Tax=Mycolicibacterium madagascariense TaxID=212765 RepID=A0A7I7XH73_9MYCO|nr:hypothetical protein [Mycolicibacterium madagascariense]MCV7014373.1 hypothetical protein [Mycolicibacterium madagascariense]BBZ28534.1 hypothetical protein MMAD_28290 [Mycolicibacterium madagascariense]